MAFTIDGYEIDVEVSSDISFENEVTEHPVETGSDVADHVRARPVTLNVEGVVSNTPIGALAERRNAFVIVSGEAFILPADEARARLLAIREAREPIIVECSQGVFANMVMQSFNPRASTEDALRFTATFVQVQLVTNARTTVRVAARGKKQNRGNAPSIEAPDAPAPTGKTTTAVATVPEFLRP